MKHVAVYIRVSSTSQDHRSQLPDLERWAAAQDAPVKWYTDKFTGRTMSRPGWAKLEADMQSGKISSIAVWKIDRLGRTTAGLATLFKELIARQINLVSLKDNVDLSTPGGRLLAHVLASVAEYDNESRRERILAGQAVARAKGKRWGGSEPGRRVKVTDEQVKVITRMRKEGEGVSAIARACGLSRPTIYEYIN